MVQELASLDLVAKGFQYYYPSPYVEPKVGMLLLTKHFHLEQSSYVANSLCLVIIICIHIEAYLEKISSSKTGARSASNLFSPPLLEPRFGGREVSFSIV